MKLPAPHDLAQAPLWENHVVARAVHASLGRLPQSTVAYGVGVEDSQIELKFQLSRDDVASRTLMESIRERLAADLDAEVTVRYNYEVRQERAISAPSEFRWIFLERIHDD